MLSNLRHGRGGEASAMIPEFLTWNPRVIRRPQRQGPQDEEQCWRKDYEVIFGKIPMRILPHGSYRSELPCSLREIEDVQEISHEKPQEYKTNEYFNPHRDRWSNPDDLRVNETISDKKSSPVLKTTNHFSTH